MPNVTVYIRNEDMDKWRALQNKSEAVAALLNETAPSSPIDKVMDKAYEGLADKFAELAPRSEPVKESPQVDIQDVIEKAAHLRPHTAEYIRTQEIAPLQAEVDAADTFNQDPDYWDVINSKKARIQELWDEYHLLKGEK